jgi:hypothetical protein
MISISPSSITHVLSSALDMFNYMKPVSYQYGKAPSRIKSYVSFWNVRERGPYVTFRHDPKKGNPRPGWTYRAARRNRKKAPWKSLLGD